MVKEGTERGRAMGRLNLTGKDVAKISQWIEDDAVSQDVYNEKLNEILDLGAQAGKWAHKIRNPRTLADKLDVKPGMRISLIGVTVDLENRTSDITEGKAAKESDLIFFGAGTHKDLAKLRPLEKSIKRNGAIWVVYPKGRTEITETGVLEAGRQAGLVDTKIARFSDTHTAHKFVIPLAKR